MIKYILEENKVSTVFELYIVELVKELFKQLRLEASMRYFGKMNIPTSNFTRCKLKVVSIPPTAELLRNENHWRTYN